MKELENQGKKQTTDSLSEIMNIDRLVHSPARLSILTYLSVVEEGDAVYLLNQTGLTWGNLSANVTRLQEAGYIEVVKEFKDKKPHTLLKLTDKGRKAFQGYQNKMKGLLDIKKPTSLEGRRISRPNRMK
jgi:DNA-binding MarR family transcriptional regulator